MVTGQPNALGRRAFVAGGALTFGCARREPSPFASEPSPPALPPPGGYAARIRPSTYALFDAFPALERSLPRVELGCFPSAIERSTSLVGEGRLWIKRDDDFTRALSCPSTSDLSRVYGGGKVRKLELFFGDARARGKRRIATIGGVGSNQALAVALLGRAANFGVRLYLAPQPPSSLTTRNLGAGAASLAEMRLFTSVAEGQAHAERDARASSDTYVIPPGGTTPLGTLGFVNAGLELAEDVRAGRLPAPRRIYVALGLGGTAAGLGIGCAIAGLRTEVVAVRTSNPTTVSASTLRAIYDATLAFVHARDPSFPAVTFEDANVRIDGRFVGKGYGYPTPAGDDAVARARVGEDWELDPVYTGKALAAALDDDRRPGLPGPSLFWHTASSRPVTMSPVPGAFQRYAR